MTLIVTEVNSKRLDPIEEGVHVAVCYGVIDLGTQEKKIFGGESHEVLIQWELPECKLEYEQDGATVNSPRVISKRYRLSLNEKATLRKDLESWRGRSFTAEELAGFDLKSLLGTACQLQIVHREKGGRTFANIASIMALPGTMSPPSKSEHELVFFSFEEAGNNPEIPTELPDWIKNLIADSKEWQSRSRGNSMDKVPHDDITDDDRSQDEDDVPGVPF